MHVTIRSTSHAQSGQARRNLSDQDVRFVFEHGRRMRCAGALHVFLGRRDIPADKEIHSRFAHLEGTMLVMDDTQGRGRLDHGLPQSTGLETAPRQGEVRPLRWAGASQAPGLGRSAQRKQS